MNKYRNKKTIVDGIEFDSKREADRWRELKLLEIAGAITNLQRQVKFELIPKQVETVPRYGKDGKRLKDKEVTVEKACDYIADFVYEMNGEKIVEDVKGYRDPSSAAYAKFVIKRKLMLFSYGIKVREV